MITSPRVADMTAGQHRQEAARLLQASKAPRHSPSDMASAQLKALQSVAHALLAHQPDTPPESDKDAS